MLIVKDRVQEGMVWFKSGHFYSFYYSNYQNDPIPTVIMLNYVYGTHPTTGNRHNYIQCINLSYINRNIRKKFIDMWMPTYQYNRGNVKLTWDMVIKKYPYLKFAVRRYLLKRNMMKYAKEIKEADIEKEVVSTWTRDYSVMAMKQLTILNDRMRPQRPGKPKNQMAKSLSKYLYKRSSMR